MRIVDLFRFENPPELSLRKRPGTWTLAEIRSAVAALAKGIATEKKEVVLGLAYLWHDHWVEAHEIAQSREGEKDFDYLHCLVHRREPDYANALYWLCESGSHSWQLRLREKFLPGGNAGVEPWNQIFPQGDFLPGKFIQAIEAHPEDSELRLLQAREYLEFFQYLVGGIT